MRGNAQVRGDQDPPRHMVMGCWTMSTTGLHPSGFRAAVTTFQLIEYLTLARVSSYCERRMDGDPEIVRVSHDWASDRAMVNPPNTPIARP